MDFDKNDIFYNKIYNLIFLKILIFLKVSYQKLVYKTLASITATSLSG